MLNESDDRRLTRAKRDFKFISCLEFALAQSRIGNVTGQLAPIKTAFEQNISRLRATLAMPLFAMQSATTIERVYAISEWKMTGTLEFVPFVSERSQEQTTLAARMMADEDAKVDFGDDEVMKQFFEALKQHVRSLESAGNITNGQLDGGMDALFGSLVTGTWTAIETLAGDLWEAALNGHPKGLSRLSEDPKRLRKGSVERPASGNRKERQFETKHVELNLIQMFNYDLSQRMGTVLRNKFSFERLDGIREAYGSAFPPFAPIDDSLKCDFFDALNAVRNVIVHKAGIADGEYVRRAATLPIPETAIGASVLLDGESASGLATGALDSAATLLSGVNEWLVANTT